MLVLIDTNAGGMQFRGCQSLEMVMGVVDVKGPKPGIYATTIFPVISV
jgi:hypothetical protein